MTLSHPVCVCVCFCILPKRGHIPDSLYEVYLNLKKKKRETFFIMEDFKHTQSEIA